MDRYKTLKTTMGHKYRVRMAEDEAAERDLYRLTIIALPFVCSVLMSIIFFARG